jgi:hypothetical protein
MRFRVSHALINVLISCRFFANCYFSQLILTRFPRDFAASKNSKKWECRFSRRIRGIFGRIIADPFLYHGRHDWRRTACRTVGFQLPFSFLACRVHGCPLVAKLAARGATRGQPNVLGLTVSTISGWDKRSANPP